VNAAFETARDFAEHGLRVFPIRGKEPLTRNGWHDASTDERQLLAWNQRCPGADWAAPGGANDLAFIDIDPGKGADPREVIDRYDLGGRPTVWTGDHDGVRGAHVYASGTQTGNNIGVAPGIDIIGGYAVLPGSRHASGVAYEWADGRRPWNTPLLPVSEPLRPRSTAGAGIMPERQGRVPYGERHAFLTDAAVRFACGRFTDEHLIACLLETVFEVRCEPLPPPRPGEFTDLAAWAVRSKIAQRERRRERAADPFALVVGTANVGRRNGR
jgi:hypothetical protein